MSIVMNSVMHPLPSFDPFNQYPTSLFSAHEHFTHDIPFLYTPHTFQVDPGCLNTSFAGHASLSSASPPPFYGASHPAGMISDTNLLPLSPSSSAAPIPPLSGSRNRARPLSNRFRSFSDTTKRMQRRYTDPARRANTTIRTTLRLSKQASAPAPPAISSTGHDSPPTGFPPSAYMASPPAGSPREDSDGRPVKRRKTSDHDSIHLHHQTLLPQLYTAIPAAASPFHPMGSTQHPHYSHQLYGHGYGGSQTWTGPPSAPSGDAVVPHGVHQWPVVGLHYYPLAADQTQHHINEPPVHDIPPNMIPYVSPTLSGATTYFSSPPAPVVASSPRPYAKKTEPDSPFFDQDFNTEVFEHPPTDCPPKPYPGGPGAKSPWTPVKPVGKIYGSRLEQMPAIENRLAKLEDQLDHYLDIRAEQALKNSLLPGLSVETAPIQAKRLGPSRLFGGRIWPTALARRVRRTRD